MRGGEGEREIERERDACDVIRYHAEIASDHAYDYLDGASTRSEPVECSCIRQGAWCLSARAACSRQWSSDL